MNYIDQIKSNGCLIMEMGEIVKLIVRLILKKLKSYYEI